MTTHFYVQRQEAELPMFLKTPLEGDFDEKAGRAIRNVFVPRSVSG